VAQQREDDVMASIIGSLARAILAAPPPSPDAIRQAKLLLLDTIGCGLRGAREAVARAVFETCDTGRGECAIIGRAARCGMLDAVLANGVSIRVLDLNDYLVNVSKGEPETGGHPSDNIPVALAAGTARAGSGAEILSAIVTGYELYARLQRMMDRGGAWDGVTVSGLVAAAIAGRLMRLDETRLAHTMALGLARAATPAIVRRGHISASKSIANALVAQSGMQAAMLAGKGITGPLAILEGEFGLRGLFANDDAESLAHAIPPDGAIMRAHVKAYPCVNTGQGAVAAALALRKILRNGPDALDEVELDMAGYPVIERQQTDEARNNPQTREAADHSFPFIVAVSIIDGAFGLVQYENERWRDPRVVALMRKIQMRRGHVPGNDVASPFPCAIRAWDRDRTEYTVDPVDPPGTSKTGLQESAVTGKFHSIAEPVLTRDARERIVDAVMEFDHSPSSEKLSTAIAIEET